MIRKILRHPNPMLRQVSGNVDAGAWVDRAALIADLIDTARETNAVGLAAVQIGIALRVCVVALKVGEYQDFINPEIIQASGVRHTREEECLSLPWAKVRISRPGSVIVRHLRFDQEIAVVRHLTGLPACALQHEIDHMNGILITDYKERADA